MNKDNLVSDDWLELQRKYWTSWTEMSRKAMGVDGGDATGPWQGALDHWWKAVSPAAPPAARELMEKMMEQGKSFFRMSENLLRGASGGDAWSAFSKALDDMRARFASGSGDMNRMMGFWELPYDNWQRMMSSMSPMPGDFLRNMPHDAVKGQVDRLLSAPGLGYTREEQGQYQDLMRRALDYQTALQEHMGFYSKLGTKSVDRMREYMQSVIESGKTIDSARAIYDNWVACCEAVYAEEVSTTEYARMHGHLVNAQMALKQRMSIMVDEYLGAMNMPTRSEVQTLQNRLQDTRRENKRILAELHALQRAVASALGTDVAALRAPGQPVRLALTASPDASATKKIPAKPSASTATPK